MDEAGRPAGAGVSPETLAAMFEQAPGFMALLRGPDHVFELTNAAYRQLVGHRDVVGLPVAEALPEVVGQGFIELLDRVRATGEAFVGRDVPITFQPAPGAAPEARVLDFVYQPVRGAGGTVSGIFVEGTDVTERVRTDAALRASDARQAFVGELGARVLALAPDEDPSFVAAELLGRTLGVSRVGFGTVDPDRETLHVGRDYTAPGVGSLAGSLRLRDYGSFVDSLKAGEVVTIADAREDPRTAPAAAALESQSARSFANVPVLENGRLVAVMFVNHAEPRDWSADDVALLRLCAERTRAAVERARAEADLRDSEAQFRAFAQAVPNHVWAARPDGGLYWFNHQVYAYAGEAEGTLDGAAWTRIVHPEDLPAAASAWAQALAAGTVYETEFRVRRADGSYRWFLTRAEPVRGEGGAILRWVGTNTDIDDRRQAEGELRGLAATLEARVAERTAEREALARIVETTGAFVQALDAD